MSSQLEPEVFTKTFKTKGSIIHVAVTLSIFVGTFAVSLTCAWLIGRAFGNAAGTIAVFGAIAVTAAAHFLGEQKTFVMFNAGLTKKRPQFDRYTIEEKLEYWALLWGQLVMGTTGFIMWFPLVVTALLPGEVFAIARTLHRWEAILAALAILTWHMYHGCIKDGNRSIFTGLMSEEEMQHVHPLEYQRILAADAYLKKMAAVERPPSLETAARAKGEHGTALGLGEAD